MRWSWLAVACSAASLLGCAAPTEPPDDYGFARQLIKDGFVDTTDKGVVGIVHVPTTQLCSGTLIAENVVLTARHCVSRTFDAMPVNCSASYFGPAEPPEGFFVSTANVVDISNAGEFFVTEVVLLPDNDGSLCGGDIAILILSENVPSSTATAYEPRVSQNISSGETYSAIGYGAIDGNNTDPGTRRRRDDSMVQCLGTTCMDAGVVGGEWLGTEGICSGDSGGPAVDNMNRVMGVTSRSGADCGDSVYANTVASSDFLKDTAVYASGIGLYDAPGWTAGSTVDPRHSMPVGADCASDSDCPAGYCVNDGNAGYCSRPCTAQAPCPSGYDCVNRGGDLVCALAEPASGPPLASVRRDDGCSIGASGASGAPNGGSWAWLLSLWLLRRRAVRVT